MQLFSVLQIVWMMPYVSDGLSASFVLLGV